MGRFIVDIESGDDHSHRGCVGGVGKNARVETSRDAWELVAGEVPVGAGSLLENSRKRRVARARPALPSWERACVLRGEGGNER
jgi:hypothetical protein